MLLHNDLNSNVVNFTTLQVACFTIQHGIEGTTMAIGIGNCMISSNIWHKCGE